MSCDNIKNGLFSCKIVCENNLKRASDCFSDTLENQIFPGEIPRTPLTRGGPPPLVLSPCFCFGFMSIANITKATFSGLRLLLQIINGRKMKCTIKLWCALAKACIFAVLALIAQNRKSCGFQGSSSRSHSQSLSWFLTEFPSKHCLFLQLWVKLFLYECWLIIFK